MQINLDRVRLGSILNKNNCNIARKRLLEAILIPEYLDFHSGYCAPRSRAAGIYFGIYSYAVSDPISKTVIF